MRLFYSLIVAAALVMGSGNGASAQAVPATPDTSSQSSVSQGEAHGVLGGSSAADAKSPAALAAQIKPAPVMTPEQAAQNWRPAYRLPEQYQKQVNAMTPAQRQDIVNQSYKSWKTMSIADKAKLHNIAAAEFEQLPADDQRELERQALDTWRSMSAEEQQDLKDTFGLQGDLDLTGSGFESQ